MTANEPRITRERLGSWLLKTRPGPGALLEPGADGRRVFRERCVARTYRAQLMQPGDPVLLWLSGPSGGHGPTPGIWGVGQVTDAAGVNEAGQFAVGLELPVADEVLLARDVLRADRGLAALEVLRMPAASNPSWLDREQWDALRGLLG